MDTTVYYDKPKYPEVNLMGNEGQILIASAIALGIMVVALSIAENIQHANVIEVQTPYSTIRAANYNQLAVR